MGTGFEILFYQYCVDKYPERRVILSESEYDLLLEGVKVEKEPLTQRETETLLERDLLNFIRDIKARCNKNFPLITNIEV